MIEVQDVSPLPAEPNTVRVTFMSHASQAIQTPVDFEDVFVVVEKGTTFALDLPSSFKAKAGDRTGLEKIAFQCVQQRQAEWVWESGELPAGTKLLPGLALKP